MLSRFVRLASLAALTLSAACTEGAGSVTRMAGGVRYEGRFIDPEAYSAYIVGIEHETRGEYTQAVGWYVEARAEDPESPEIWARIGACQCFGSAEERGPNAARRAFENGIQLEPLYYGNYFERARCEERARSFEAALADARAAVARKPQDEPANLLVARLLQAQGRTVDARAWLEAFRSFQQTSPAMEHALEAARAPAATPGGAKEALPALGARSVAFAELHDGNFERAKQHAETELGADPTNSDAWIAALVACDALRDRVCFDETLERLAQPALAPSDTGLRFLNELLSRRAGTTLTR